MIWIRRTNYRIHFGLFCEKRSQLLGRVINDRVCWKKVILICKCIVWSNIRLEKYREVSDACGYMWYRACLWHLQLRQLGRVPGLLCLSLSLSLVRLTQHIASGVRSRPGNTLSACPLAGPGQPGRYGGLLQQRTASTQHFYSQPYAYKFT